MRALTLGLVAWGMVSAIGISRAEPPERDVDFAGGFVVNQAPSDAFESFPGVAMQARYFANDWLYVAGMLTGDLGFDLRNPEAGEMVPLLGIGAGAGLYRDFDDRITAFAGGRVEWLHAWGWPDGENGEQDFHSGLRTGPTAGIALRIASGWGHPMSIEVNASYLYYRVPRAEYEIQIAPGAAPVTNKGLQIGFFVTGVLFPEPTGTVHGKPTPLVASDL